MKDRISQNEKAARLIGIFIFSLMLSALLQGAGEGRSADSLESLLPEVKGMGITESPQNYYPETLFEYIDGAAEIYLAYDFRQLIVAQYKKADAPDSLTVEIYDMGNPKNSFGIYSAERYPDNRFIPVGTQGYIEEDALNFLVGNYYVKLLCYDCGEKAEGMLTAFSENIADKVGDAGKFPALLDSFPKEGMLPNTEKFILRNVMGYRFMHDGYVANYKTKDLAFDCFLVEGDSPEDARDMLEQYLKAKGAAAVQKISSGYRIKDRYYHNIYLARVGRYLCGVMKVEDGFEEVGERYLQRWIQSLEQKFAISMGY
jgi:hypothetical protein